MHVYPSVFKDVSNCALCEIAAFKILTTFDLCVGLHVGRGKKKS